MSRGFSYGEAVRLLGGKGPVARRIEQLTGGLAPLAVAGGVPALAGFLRAGHEFVDLCHKLVRGVSEQRSGLSRYDRTQRLEAAETVLLFAAYFESLETVPLPIRHSELAITAEDKVRLTTTTDTAVTALFGGPISFLLDDSLANRIAAVEVAYEAMSEALIAFIPGLAVWDRLTDTDRQKLERALASVVPAHARRRYEDLLRQLSAQFPEVGYWTNLREHTATRTQTQQVAATVETGLANLERLLINVTTGGAPDARREALARAYRAAMEEPIVTSGDVPDVLRLPTLDHGYVVPRFRLCESLGRAVFSEESWWEDVPVSDQLDNMLAGYLTSSRATTSTLLILGQPGSGKSVLTKVLAARLPAADFLPVRVVLREVSATNDPQEQIESAIRAATGEEVRWPELSRSAGPAMPVLIFDGFDELLQATGVAQTDYLIRVADFQRREMVQGRPVAVIVTSRTSVADRARPPAQMMALRLEPFDADQVSHWLAIWNTVNEAPLRAQGLDPLPPEVVLAHPELAGQPLLLLMLALYDADGNALQRAEGALGQDELYERLLRSFARREITKQRPDLPDRDHDRAIERELKRLSVAAFAMFNRGHQWITETELEADLAALLREGGTAAPTGIYDLRTPLNPGEIVLGRFFFVHRARASRDDTALETYEFLHATFGEFLVARLTWQVLQSLTAQEEAATFPLDSVSDDFLHALLSFSVLSRRSPQLTFLRDMAGTRTDQDQAAIVNLLTRLFRQAHQPRAGRSFDNYQPRTLPVPARHAAYAANLVLLTVCVAGSVRVSHLYQTQDDPIPVWRNEATLWKSQLSTDEWESIVGAIEPNRLDERGRILDERRRRDLELRYVIDEPLVPTPLNITWNDSLLKRGIFHRGKVSSSTGRILSISHVSMSLLCDPVTDAVHHAIEPIALSSLWEPVAATHVTFDDDGDSIVSALHALIHAWLLPMQTAPTEHDRSWWYMACAEIINAVGPLWDDQLQGKCAALLMHRLMTDRMVAPALVADVLQELVSEPYNIHELRDAFNDILQCALMFLGRDTGCDERIAAVIHTVLASSAEVDRNAGSTGVLPDPVLRQRALAAIGRGQLNSPAATDESS